MLKQIEKQWTKKLALTILQGLARSCSHGVAAIKERRMSGRFMSKAERDNTSAMEVGSGANAKRGKGARSEPCASYLVFAATRASASPSRRKTVHSLKGFAPSFS